MLPIRSTRTPMPRIVLPSLNAPAETSSGPKGVETLRPHSNPEGAGGDGLNGVAHDRVARGIERERGRVDLV
jgi:hypothetical protein